MNEQQIKKEIQLLFNRSKPLDEYILKNDLVLCGSCFYFLANDSIAYVSIGKLKRHIKVSVIDLLKCVGSQPLYLDKEQSIFYF